MTLGPIEIIEIGFPNGDIDPTVVEQVRALVDRGIVTVVDGLIVRKAPDGTVSIVEFEEPGASAIGAAFAELVGEHIDLVSAEDVDEFAVGLPAGASALVLVFEHTWAKPFRDAMTTAGGEVITQLRIPGPVVEEVLAALGEDA